MRTRSRHPRIWLAALTASVGALVLGLVPGTTAASAGPTGPVVNFVDYSSVGTHSVGSSLLDGTAKTALTPGGYLAYGYDVSDDGNTMLLSLARGSLSSAARDRTYALLLVSRVGAEVTSTILTNYWDTNPVLSADGSTAWWLAGDRVWKHQAGVSTMVSTDFVRHSDETTVGFSVSADGTTGAVVYREDGTVRTSTYTRLFAEDFVAGKAAPYLDWTGSLAAFYTNPTWLTSASLLFSYTDTSVTHNATATLGPSGGDVDTAQVYGDPGIYDVQQLGSAWWAAQGDTTSGFATAAAPTDFASATFTPFPLSASTASYLMSDVTPPAVTVPTNRARSYPHLDLSASAVKYRGKVVYDTWADYLTPLPGETLSNDAAWVARGVLQWSTNGTTWKNLKVTSWAHPVPWPRSTGKGAGYTPALTRNTWFRWIYPADLFTTASQSRTVVVKVVPIVSAKVARSGRYRIIGGAATRIGGIATLYRIVGTRLVKVAAVKLTSKGVYTFGKRALPRGYYRVLTRADKYWAAGTSVRIVVR